ncbi:MAG: ABC transporter ATP-binding protein [Eubacteriaceae bacterium]|nr:ABC transporter ATP-binding protein [Eubacteriaceae bacterium]
MIRLIDVSKNYGSVKALVDINLDVCNHDFVTIVGSSGCGKTTLLKLINGLLLPDKGEILLNGENIKGKDLVSLRRNIGYVIQDIGLFPHMNVKKNIAYVPYIKGYPKTEIEKIVLDAIDVVKLDKDLLNRFPVELSGGQKQRVGIARAIAAQTKILLMDEPFGAVDEITRRKLQDEILDMYHQIGLTIMFVTHDVQEAIKLGTKIVVMDQGKIIQYDRKENVIERPQNTFVKQLLGLSS